jgi:hypothetical protein
MQFLFPTFLWALAALAIPVIIHLFYFRKFKKVEFTNVRLLKEIKEETASRNKLKDLLILLSRLLALAFLIFAFAQPFIPSGNEIKKGDNAVSIFVDNSFSMNAVRGQTPILEIAKQKAREIIGAYSESDNFQVLTHDFEGRHQRLVSKEDALSLVDEIEISPRVKKLNNIINRQKQILDMDNSNKISYILSDFQASIMTIPELDTTLEVNLVPVQAIQEANISIDTAYLESGVAFRGQSNKLVVLIKNHSDDVVDNVRLSILKDGQEKPEGQLTIPARQSVADTINISLQEDGWHTAEIKITDYPVQFDDQYWISFYVDENLDVLNIRDGRPNRYLTALFNGLENFKFTSVSSTGINYGELDKYKLIIIHDVQALSTGMISAFNTYIENGGKLLLFPTEGCDLSSYNAFLNTVGANRFENFVEQEKTVYRINTDEFVFNGVFDDRSNNMTLPTVSKSFNLTNFQSRSQENLLTFRDGSKFLVKYSKGNGILYVCTSPLNEELNNLVLNAEIFVPMVFKMAIAKASSDPISYFIGDNVPIEVKKGSNNAEMVYTIKGNVELIPAQINLGNKVYLQENGQIDQSGIYRLENAGQLEKILAYNYDRLESDMTISDLENLPPNWNIIDNTLSADFTSIISEKDKGIILWKWCLILALIFLAIESLLLRFWKK